MCKLGLRELTKSSLGGRAGDSGINDGGKECDRRHDGVARL